MGCHSVSLAPVSGKCSCDATCKAHGKSRLVVSSALVSVVARKDWDLGGGCSTPSPLPSLGTWRSRLAGGDWGSWVEWGSQYPRLCCLKPRIEESPHTGKLGVLNFFFGVWGTGSAWKEVHWGGKEHKTFPLLHMSLLYPLHPSVRLPIRHPIYLSAICLSIIPPDLSGFHRLSLILHHLPFSSLFHPSSISSIYRLLLFAIYLSTRLPIHSPIYPSRHDTIIPSIHQPMCRDKLMGLSRDSIETPDVESPGLYIRCMHARNVSHACPVMPACGAIFSAPHHFAPHCT